MPDGIETITEGQFKDIQVLLGASLHRFYKHSANAASAGLVFLSGDPQSSARQGEVVGHAKSRAPVGGTVSHVKHEANKSGCFLILFVCVRCL